MYSLPTSGSLGWVIFNRSDKFGLYSIEYNEMFRQSFPVLGQLFSLTHPIIPLLKKRGMFFLNTPPSLLKRRIGDEFGKVGRSFGSRLYPCICKQC